MVTPAALKHRGNLWPGRNLEIFSKWFPAVGGKVDVRDTWVGVLTELLGSVISRWAEHFFGHQGCESKRNYFFLNPGKAVLRASVFTVLNNLEPTGAPQTFSYGAFHSQGAEVLCKVIMESHSTWSLCSATPQQCSCATRAPCQGAEKIWAGSCVKKNNFSWNGP